MQESSEGFRFEGIFETASEYTMFASTQILRKLREQRPSNKDDLDSGVAGENERVYYTGQTCLI